MESTKRNAGKQQSDIKREQERHQEHRKTKTQSQSKINPPENSQDSLQREWKKAQEEQQQFAEQPGVDKSDLKQHDERGNPTLRDEDLEAEM